MSDGKNHKRRLPIIKQWLVSISQKKATPNHKVRPPNNSNLPITTTPTPRVTTTTTPALTATAATAAAATVAGTATRQPASATHPLGASVPPPQAPTAATATQATRGRRRARADNYAVVAE